MPIFCLSVVVQAWFGRMNETPWAKEKTCESLNVKRVNHVNSTLANRNWFISEREI